MIMKIAFHFSKNMKYNNIPGKASKKSLLKFEQVLKLRYNVCVNCCVVMIMWTFYTH